MKTRLSTIIALVCISVAVISAVGYQAWRYRVLAVVAQQKRDALIREVEILHAEWGRLSSEVSPVRESLVTSTVGKNPGDPLAYARAIRDYVYRTNIYGRSSNTDGGGGSRIFMNLGQRDHEQLCGGMSSSYAWALNSVGIPARTVQLAAQSFVDGEALGDTHVTVEMLIDGEWRISDPTFNVELQCSNAGGMLDTEGARLCVAGGSHLVPVYGNTQIPGQTFFEYRLPYDRFLVAYEINTDAGAIVSTPKISYPTPDWLATASAQYRKSGVD